MWWGKLVGAVFGYMIAGPFGAILGGLIGNSFDSSLSTNWSGWHIGFSPADLQRAQRAFFATTFAAMGHIAKADGRISEQEIQAARIIMSQMHLDEEHTRDAMLLFNEGKHPNFDLNHSLQKLMEACQKNRPLLKMFLDIQVRAAYAEGLLSSSKKDILQHISRTIGLGAINFRHYDYAFSGAQAGARSGAGYRTGGGAGQRRAYQESPKSRLKRANRCNYFL